MRTLLDMTPPRGAQSDYPLGVNPEPSSGKVTLTSDQPRRLAFPSASAGGILPARVRLFEMPDGKYRRLRVEEVWSDRDRREVIARLTMVGDHLLVSLADGADATRLRAALPVGFSLRRTLRGSGALLVSFPVENEDSLPAARVALENLGQTIVQRVEPDTFVHTASIPNDPLFGDQWGLHNTGQDGGTPDADIDAPEAWDLRTDAAAFPIAVIDTGIDYNHPDLYANIWSNPGETGTDANGQDRRSNGVDDDNNGYIDDWRGWDFANDDNDPMDDNGHGTRVAGIIGAEGNNSIGIAGVCWSCRMMPLKALTGSGGGAWSDIINAVAYAKAMKATVGNLSFGAYGAAPEEAKLAFAAANETLWCAAAGNGELPYNGNLAGDDLDEFHFFPACLDLGHLISVTATGRNDALAPFANYGRFMVDIAAPGVAIRSTSADGGYDISSGTSMSCAYVSGFCALAWPLRVQPYPINIRQLALTTVKRSEPLRNKLVTRGRLDAAIFMEMSKSKMAWRMFAVHGVPGKPPSNASCLQITPDGRVFRWGHSRHPTNGVEGTGGEQISIPVEVPLPSDARSVHVSFSGETASDEFFAILSDGSLWSWWEGTAPHPLPISDVKFLHIQDRTRGPPPTYAHESAKFALRKDGTVWSWGTGHLWKEPGGFTSSRPGPIAFAGRITQLANYSFLDDEGRFHTMLSYSGSSELARLPARKEWFPPLDRFTVSDYNLGFFMLGSTANGEAYGWGPFGQGRVPRLDGYVSVCDLRSDRGTPTKAEVYVTMSDGKVFYSGEVYRGIRSINRLGTNPVPSETDLLYEVGGITHMIDLSISPGTNVCYALDQFGRIFRWDMSDYFAQVLPIPELSGYDVVGLSTWYETFTRRGLMVFTSDFRGIAYGSNLDSVSGVGVDTTKTRPVELPALRGAQYLSLEQIGDGCMTCAVMPDGRMHMWGEYQAHYSDFGIHNNYVLPTPGVEGRMIRQCASAARLLVMEDGTLWRLQGWPQSRYVQISIPASAVGFVPSQWIESYPYIPPFTTRVMLSDGSMINLLDTNEGFVFAQDDFVAFADNPNFSSDWTALKNDGTVSWKDSAGDGYRQVDGLRGIKQISLEMALRNDGRVFVWGYSRASLLGDGHKYPEGLMSPVMVEGLTDIVEISSGYHHKVALRADGEVFIWGDNSVGQLGLGDTAEHLFLAQPYGLSGVVQIWTGLFWTIAKRADGSFWGWGMNESGAIPDGSAVVLGAPNLAYGFSRTVFNAGNGFEDWLTTFFNESELRDIELFADAKDPDNDGLANLIEYALGTNPRKPTIPLTGPLETGPPPPPPNAEYTFSIPIVRLEKVRRNYYSKGVGIAGEGDTDEETTHLVMTVPRAERRSDVDYIVEVSDDAEHWHFGAGHTVEVMNTLTRLVVYDARPLEENPHRFIRLRLVRNNPGQTSLPR